MGFAEYGDLQGSPAFFCHGSPGSRYDGIEMKDAAKKLNVRIVCPDRPGHGLSSFLQNRKLIDYPKDISQLAKHLGIAKYNVLGQSGGGPYAVACAYGSPKDELLNVGVIAGMGPPAVATIKDAGLYTVTVLSTTKYFPGFVRWFMNWCLKSEKRFQRSLRSALMYMSDEDRAELAKPGWEAEAMAVLKVAYAQGPDGAIHDAKIYGSPWGFELENVQKEIKLFYGHKDDRTPLAFGRYFKTHLPNAELVEFENATHLTIYKHYEEILRKTINSG